MVNDSWGNSDEATANIEVVKESGTAPDDDDNPGGSDEGKGSGIPVCGILAVVIVVLFIIAFVIVLFMKNRGKNKGDGKSDVIDQNGLPHLHTPSTAPFPPVDPPPTKNMAIPPGEPNYDQFNNFPTAQQAQFGPNEIRKHQ